MPNAFYLFVITFCLAFDIAPAPQAQNNTGEKSQVPQTLSVCEMLEKPELYLDKEVRLKADYLIHFEGGFLYDLPCDEIEKRIELSLQCWTDKQCKQFRTSIDKNVRRGQKNWRLHRTNLALIGQLKRTKLGDELINCPYCPANGFRYFFQVSNIEDSFPIPDSEAWPK